MPTYEFYNETKEIEEHLMSYKDLDKFAEDNTSRKNNICNLEQYLKQGQHSTRQVVIGKIY